MLREQDTGAGSAPGTEKSFTIDLFLELALHRGDAGTAEATHGC